MSKSFSSIKKELDQDDRVTFGKHAGLNWSYVIENYPDYLIWCVGNTELSFSKAAIVAAIKSKYTLKKKNTTHEIDGEYVPKKFSVPSIGDSVFNKHHGDAFGALHSDDWDNDVPF